MLSLDETVVHHCDVFSELGNRSDGHTNWDECKKNPGHENFLTVDKFGMKHLPPEWRTTEVMKYVQNLIDRTVKITVCYTSENRPDTFPDTSTDYPFCEYRGKKNFRCGTGYIDFVYSEGVGDRCPCPKCKDPNQPEMEYWKIRVITAAHVVFDCVEAKSAVIDLFYDGNNRDGVENLYGIDVLGDDKHRQQTDLCLMICITHDKGLVNRLRNLYDYRGDPSLLSKYFSNNTGILVSHPHGVSKRISMGKMSQAMFYVTQGSSVILKEGTRVSINNNTIRKQDDTHHHDLGDVNDNTPQKQENTHHHDIGNVNDRPPDKSSSQIIGEQNSETNESAAPNENVTPRPHCDFYEFLNPTTDKDVFKLKVEMKAFPPFKSLIVCDGLESPNSITFPADTKYVCPNETSVVVPVEIKIHSECRVLSGWQNCFLTYDIDSCPGSSGAYVHGDRYFDGWTHLGSEGGKNRSGLWNEWLGSNKFNDNNDCDDKEHGGDDLTTLQLR